MSPVHNHRSLAVSPDWRRLALGVIVALLMSLQGAAAMAHGHIHANGEHLVIAGHTGPTSPEAPLPGKGGALAPCQLCHSPFGSASILPVSPAGLAPPVRVVGADLPLLHQAHPISAPAGVWRVRGPPLSLLI